MRKTRGMLAFERQHDGRPIEEMIAEAYTAHGNLPDAARSLGLTTATFYQWMRMAGVEIKRIASVA